MEVYIYLTIVALLAGFIQGFPDSVPSCCLFR